MLLQDTIWGMVAHWYVIGLLRCLPGFKSGRFYFSNDWYEIFLLLQEGRVGNDAATISQFIQGTANAQQVMGVSIRIMSHAAEGQDSNLISSNTEEIEFNCDQSINLACF